MTDQRVRTKIPAEFKADDLLGRGEVRNVSDGGLFVGTLAIPQEGSTVEVKMRAPGKVAVKVQGLVWWTAPTGRESPSGFGLRILDDDEGYRRLVASVR
jgi:uncharacterized protein (TIGR02266 family)